MRVPYSTKVRRPFLSQDLHLLILHLNCALGYRLAKGRKVVKCYFPHLGADSERMEFHKDSVDWLGSELSNHLRL